MRSELCTKPCKQEYFSVNYKLQTTITSLTQVATPKKIPAFTSNPINVFLDPPLQGGIGAPLDNTGGSFPELCVSTNMFCISSANTIKRRTVLNCGGLLENFTEVNQPECGTFNDDADWFQQQQFGRT